MQLASAVREAFPQAEFGAPVSLAGLAEAERALGHPLPPLLHDLYLTFDGFVGPANAQFLYPLASQPRPMRESLVSFTNFLRGEVYCPSWLRAAVAVGDAGTGPVWFVPLDRPDSVVLWEAEWGSEYEELDGSLLDVWLKQKAIYDLRSRDA